MAGTALPPSGGPPPVSEEDQGVPGQAYRQEQAALPAAGQLLRHGVKPAGAEAVSPCGPSAFEVALKDHRQ